MVTHAPAAEWIRSCVDAAKQTFLTSLGEQLHILESEMKTPEEVLDYELQQVEDYRRLMAKIMSPHESRLKRAKNAVVPIHQLPLEIFTNILEGCLAEDNPWSQSSGPLHRLAQVSSAWLQTIKATPALWQYLSSEDTAYTRTLVARFNTTGPIKILCQTNDRSAKSTLETAISCASQWESTHIIGSPRSISLACSRLTVPMPNLKELYVHAHNERDRDEEDEEEVEEDENGLNDGESPRIILGEGRNLLDIKLIGTSLSWGSSRLSGLRAISLLSLKQNIPTIPQLHAILSTSPSLQTLILADFDYDGGDDALGTVDLRHSIHLGQLSTLELKEIPSKITNFLLSIIEPGCAMSLTVYGLVASSSSDLSSRLLEIPSMVPTAQHITVRYNNARRSMGVYLTPHNLGVGERIHGIRDEVGSFSVELKPEDALGWSVLASWLAGFTLPQLAFKTVSSAWNMTSNFPSDFLNSLPSLVSLDIGSSFVLFAIFGYLAKNPGVCPHLTEIKLGPNSTLFPQQIAHLARLAKARKQGQLGGPEKIKDVWMPRHALDTLRREVGESDTVYHPAW